MGTVSRPVARSLRKIRDKFTDTSSPHVERANTASVRSTASAGKRETKNQKGLRASGRPAQNFLALREIVKFAKIHIPKGLRASGSPARISSTQTVETRDARRKSREKYVKYGKIARVETRDGHDKTRAIQSDAIATSSNAHDKE